jgi:hypothetical protein
MMLTVAVGVSGEAVWGLQAAWNTVMKIKTRTKVTL